MAFQIVDDILDFRATEEQLGKPVGGDLRQGTVTLPVMFYLENASAEERETIRRVVEGDGLTEERLATAISRINESGAVERASRIANRFVEEAKASVLGFEDNEARRSLLSLADFAVSRSF
jgi:heptaprenyl diphosphate synthase